MLGKELSASILGLLLSNTIMMIPKKKISFNFPKSRSY